MCMHEYICRIHTNIHKLMQAYMYNNFTLFDCLNNVFTNAARKLYAGLCQAPLCSRMEHYSGVGTVVLDIVQWLLTRGSSISSLQSSQSSSRLGNEPTVSG